jgi:hypothetical protein
MGDKVYMKYEMSVLCNKKVYEEKKNWNEYTLDWYGEGL